MDARIFRQRARENLRGNWGLSIGIAAVASLLGGLLVGFNFLPELDSRIPVLQELAARLNHEIQLGNLSFHLNLGTGSVLSLAAFIIGGVLELGYANILLKQHDHQPFEFRDLFSQFDRFGDGFAQHFLRGLYVTLWSLLLVIPGVIASYSYAMTPFIMAEHPELTASQAIRRSKEMMDGHKGELFVLEISFFGWMLLCTLTLNIGNLFLNPYINAAYAAFYRQLQAENKDTSYE